MMKLSSYTNTNTNTNILAYCSNENKPCTRWVQKYFKDCLCNLSDEISFSLGIVGLVCWGVAEIPQIFTNFTNKSGHGVSLAFLLTWIAGDIFNLVGCVLEPATLPTQYYTAVLYTVSTVILVLQIVYYDYICQWWKGKNRDRDSEEEEDDTKPHKQDSLETSLVKHSAPLKVTRRKDVYYTSARSLASSDTPPLGSYLRTAARSGPSVLEDINSSSEDEETAVSPKHCFSQPIRIPHAAGYGAFLLTSAKLPFQAKALMEGYTRISGRRLLQEHGMENNVYGVWLGWMMAAIYMGGRLPQIWLNIKRGTVEGLNPLMFMFALLANATYVGSIVVRSTEWKKIKPNLPWLLDAVVCVALDLFIILQFVYYKFMQKKRTNNRRDYEDYVEAKKADLS